MYIYEITHYNVNEVTHIANWLSNGTVYTCEHRNG